MRLLDETSSSLSNRDAGGGIFILHAGNVLIPDPAYSAGVASKMLHLEIFSGLTKIIDDPNAPVRPELAERYSISDDRLTYEFMLKAESEVQRWYFPDRGGLQVELGASLEPIHRIRRRKGDLGFDSRRRSDLGGYYRGTYRS